MEKEIICVFCKGKAKLEFEDIDLHDGKLILKSQPYYKCIKCKKDFVTRDQMVASEKEITEHFSFKRPIISTGRSKGMTFPADLVDFYNLNQGKIIRIIPENKNVMKVIVD